MSTAKVKVIGVDSNVLLDTGSKVTTVSQTFYNLYETIQSTNWILSVQIVSEFHMQVMNNKMCNFQKS